MGERRIDMGNIITIFKKRTDTNNIITIFKNGYLIKTKPGLTDYYNERDKINSSRFIISDGVKYDLEKLESIENIKIQNFSKAKSYNLPGEYELGQLGYLDYILRMKASELRNRNENTLSVSILKKAHEMMKHSPICWDIKDYMRLVYWLYEDGLFEEAEQYEADINYMFRDNSIYQQITNNIKRYAKMGYDLTVTDSFNGCCAECAKYRQRIYSISGKDKRFPKVPAPWKCECQGITFSLITDSHALNGCFPNNDYIGCSNRPFRDDRTEEEKLLHRHYLDRKIYDFVNHRDRKNYFKIKHFLPELAPKSQSAFSRMRNANTVLYQELCSKTKELGFDISVSDEEKAAINRYLKNKKEKGWR